MSSRTRWHVAANQLLLALAMGLVTFDVATGQTNTFPSSGNVGIGTTSPVYSLDVKGGTNAFHAKASTSNGSDTIANFESSTGIVAIIRANGYVGIGTTSPQSALHVAGSLLLTGNSPMSNPGSVGPAFNAGYYATGGYAFFQGFNYTSSSYIPLVIEGSKTVINGNSGGNVGIGNASPAFKLDVTGNGHFTGNLTVDGNLAAKYQDIAEWVDSSQQLAQGTVVVLDTNKSNQVVASTQSYDSRVAGVISPRPGLTLGEGGAGRVLVATTGRVRVRVDAGSGPIQIGDLLVTSNIPGVAMKSSPVDIGGVRIHRPGTLIGKALEPLASGRGEIFVLLSLQ